MGTCVTRMSDCRRRVRWRIGGAIQRIPVGRVTNAGATARSSLCSLSPLGHGFCFRAVYRLGVRHWLSRFFADTTFCGAENRKRRTRRSSEREPAVSIRMKITRHRRLAPVADLLQKIRKFADSQFVWSGQTLFCLDRDERCRLRGEREIFKVTRGRRLKILGR